MLYEEYRFDDMRLPGISPVCCGTEQCEPGFSVGATRPYWMLHFVVSGKGSFSTGGVTGLYTPLSACGSLDRILGGTGDCMFL